MSGLPSAISIARRRALGLGGAIIGTPPPLNIPPPLSVPSGSGFNTPAYPQNLLASWDFTNPSSLPSPWGAIVDTLNQYVPAPNQYASSMVIPSAGGLKLGASKVGSNYVCGAIGCISSGGVGHGGTPTFTLPSTCRVRFTLIGPSFPSAPGVSVPGTWWGMWAINPPGSSPTYEIDGLENNGGAATTALQTLHQWNGAGTNPWSTNSHHANVGADLAAASHVYEYILEPNQLTWGIDNIATFQLTPSNLISVGAAPAGARWNLPASNLYPLVNFNIDTAGQIGTAWSTSNDSKLPMYSTVLLGQVYGM